MKYEKLGRKIANKSTHNFRHSSLLLRGGKVLSYGYNHSNLHAEYNAVNSVWPKLRRGSILINFRLGKLGNLLNSYPCPTCLAMTINVGIKKIIYSTENGFKEVRL